MALNQCTFLGRLTREPDIRYAAETQMPIARFTLAVGRGTKKGNEADADFITCVAFDKRAAGACKTITIRIKTAIEYMGWNCGRSILILRMAGMRQAETEASRSPDRQHRQPGRIPDRQREGLPRRGRRMPETGHLLREMRLPREAPLPGGAQLAPQEQPEAGPEPRRPHAQPAHRKVS